MGYTPRRDGATRRAVSTQLVVGNPVYAHYRRHVTPGVCRREGTLRRGFPRPEPRLVGSQARQPSAKRWALLEPGGFPLIAWLARARACPQSHRVPVRERRCAAARVAGRTLRAAVDRNQRSVMWRSLPRSGLEAGPRTVQLFIMPCWCQHGQQGTPGGVCGVRAQKAVQ